MFVDCDQYEPPASGESTLSAEEVLRDEIDFDRYRSASGRDEPRDDLDELTLMDRRMKIRALAARRDDGAPGEAGCDDESRFVHQRECTAPEQGAVVIRFAGKNDLGNTHFGNATALDSGSFGRGHLHHALIKEPSGPVRSDEHGMQFLRRIRPRERFRPCSSHESHCRTGRQGARVAAGFRALGRAISGKELAPTGPASQTLFELSANGPFVPDDRCGAAPDSIFAISPDSLLSPSFRDRHR